MRRENTRSLDADTKLYTLRLGFEPTLVEEGGASIVLAHQRWLDLRATLKPSRDVAQAAAKLKFLAAEDMETLARMGWFTFPMKSRAGLFELRKNGVRFYGGRIGTLDDRAVHLLAGGESKGGKTQASPAELDRVCKILDAAKKKWAETASPTDDNVIPLNASRRKKRKR